MVAVLINGLLNSNSQSGRRWAGYPGCMEQYMQRHNKDGMEHKLYNQGRCLAGDTPGKGKQGPEERPCGPYSGTGPF